MAAGQVVLHEAFILRNTTEPQDLPKSLAGHVHSFNIIVAELLGSFGDNEFLPGTFAPNAA